MKKERKKRPLELHDSATSFACLLSGGELVGKKS